MERAGILCAAEIVDKINAAVKIKKNTRLKESTESVFPTSPVATLSAKPKKKATTRAIIVSRFGNFGLLVDLNRFPPIKIGR